MMDTPQPNQNNNKNKRNKRWRRFRNKKNAPQPLSKSQESQKPLSKPQESKKPPFQQRPPAPLANNKPPHTINQSRPNTPHQPKQPPPPTGAFDQIKRSKAREILPPNYKLPEDLDIPSYVFDSANTSSPETAESPSTENPTDEVMPKGQICSLCNYPIKKFYTTIRHPVNDDLVHFDCALREVFHQNKTRLARDEHIYYIGAGRFAIVKEIRDKRGNVRSHQIIEKIEYEKHD